MRKRGMIIAAAAIVIIAVGGVRSMTKRVIKEAIDTPAPAPASTSSSEQSASENGADDISAGVDEILDSIKEKQEQLDSIKESIKEFGQNNIENTLKESDNDEQTNNEADDSSEEEKNTYDKLDKLKEDAETVKDIVSDFKDIKDALSNKDDQCVLELKISSEKNKAFSKYDIDLYFDDDYIGTVENGETLKTSIYTSVGAHELTAVSAKDNDISETKKIKVKKDCSFSCRLDHEKKSIKFQGEKMKD